MIYHHLSKMREPAKLAAYSKQLICIADFVDNSVLADEFERWWVIHCKMNISDALPTTAMGLKFCNQKPDFFPKLHTLLRIAATLPSSSTSVERTFSALRLLKTHIRSTTMGDRLSGLALT